MADTASTNTTEDDENQSAFVRTFLIVLGALIIFTLFCMVIARILSTGASGVEDDPILKADIANRLAPVGSVRTTADVDVDADGGGAGGGAATQVAAVQSGEEIVQGVCAACHISGVGGAPLLDDDAAWGSRREAGLDALTASVINGKGAMPPRAGTELSDDEIRRAVAHMAGIEIEDAAAAPAPAGDSDAASAEAPAAESDAASGETPAAESDAATGEAAAGSDTSDDAAASEAATENTDTDAGGADEATNTAAVVQNDGSQATIVAAALDDRIRNVVDGICVACHLSGVGGAPKVGDKNAWAARAEKGLAGMVAVVVAGQGAMPARGGSDLNDEQLAAAINYLMDK